MNASLACLLLYSFNNHLLMFSMCESLLQKLEIKDEQDPVLAYTSEVKSIQQRQLEVQKLEKFE